MCSNEDYPMDPMRTLKLNPLAGGIKQKALDKLEKDDRIWIDFGEEEEILTEENASRIKRIYLAKPFDNKLVLMYERS